MERVKTQDQQGDRKVGELDATIEKLSSEEKNEGHIVARSFIHCEDGKLQRIQFEGVFLNEQGEMPPERMSYATNRKSTNHAKRS